MYLVYEASTLCGKMVLRIRGFLLSHGSRCMPMVQDRILLLLPCCRPRQEVWTL